MNEQITEWITDTLIRCSPHESGPAYRFVAEHWEIAQQVVLAILVLVLLILLSLAIMLWSHG